MGNHLINFKRLMSGDMRYSSYDSMPDGLLLFFFCTSILPALYWNYVLVQLGGPFLDVFNQVGFTWEGLIASSVMGVLAVNACFFTCLAKCSGDILFMRMFK